jgi:hypothetical protein
MITVNAPSTGTLHSRLLSSLPGSRKIQSLHLLVARHVAYAPHWALKCIGWGKLLAVGPEACRKRCASCCLSMMIDLVLGGRDDSAWAHYLLPRT